MYIKVRIVTTPLHCLTCPPAARCARMSASLPVASAWAETGPALCIMDFFFLPRFEGTGMTTAGGILPSSFLSVHIRRTKRKHRYDLEYCMNTKANTDI